MPSSYSTRLRFELIGVGEFGVSGNWGTTTNTNLGTLIEESIAGIASVPVTDGAATTLTAIDGGTDQARQMIINLTGTLSAQREVRCPAVQKLYFVRNATTGGFGVLFKTASGTGVVVPNGRIRAVYCDATNVNDLITDLPAGAQLNGADIVTTTGTQTLTNKTLTSPRVGTAILDTNGNESIRIAATASAVNDIQVTNAATSGTPTISAVGNDTNIGLNLVGKGTGQIFANSLPIVTTTGAQTLSNKTIDNTNTVSASIPVGQLTGLGTGVSGGLSSAINNPGGFVGFSGALGTPTSGNLGNCTNVPLGSVSGTLAVANGGTSATTSTGSGSVVLSNSPTLSSPTFTTPTLGTPSSGTLSNCTGLPIANTTGTLAINRGGTGITTAPTNGQILIGNSSAYSLGTISSGTGVTVSSSAGAISVAIGQAVGTSAAVTFSQVTASSGIGCGTAAPTSGAIWATGDIIAFFTSDARYKENVSSIESALESVGKIRGVRFDWSQSYIDSSGGEDGYFVRKRDIGVIAQEVEAVIPEAVATREGGYKAVRYEKIVPLLIEAVKELKREVDNLRAKL